MNTILLCSVLLHITNIFAKCFIYPTTKHTELQRRKVFKKNKSHVCLPNGSMQSKLVTETFLTFLA